MTNPEELKPKGEEKEYDEETVEKVQRLAKEMVAKKSNDPSFKGLIVNKEGIKSYFSDAEKEQLVNEAGLEDWEEFRAVNNREVKIKKKPEN